MKEVGTPSEYYIDVITIDRYKVRYFHNSKRERNKNFRDLVKRVYPANLNGDLFSVKRNN